MCGQRKQADFGHSGNWLREEPEKQGHLSLISHVGLDPFLPACLSLGLPDFLLSTCMAGSFLVVGVGSKFLPIRRCLATPVALATRCL